MRRMRGRRGHASVVAPRRSTTLRGRALSWIARESRGARSLKCSRSGKRPRRTSPSWRRRWRRSGASARLSKPSPSAWPGARWARRSSPCCAALHSGTARLRRSRRQLPLHRRKRTTRRMPSRRPRRRLPRLVQWLRPRETSPPCSPSRARRLSASRALRVHRRKRTRMRRSTLRPSAPCSSERASPSTARSAPPWATAREPRRRPRRTGKRRVSKKPQPQQLRRPRAPGPAKPLLGVWMAPRRRSCALRWRGSRQPWPGSSSSRHSSPRRARRRGGQRRRRRKRLVEVAWEPHSRPPSPACWRGCLTARATAGMPEAGLGTKTLRRSRRRPTQPSRASSSSARRTRRRSSA
mmetsp:Transcript_7450/g.20305  ORF Transcript_7450/g.20305 Transcript_7450/m.20305 type:complete len:352 (+) Transcript_7450:858-1913(+)